VCLLFRVCFVVFDLFLIWVFSWFVLSWYFGVFVISGGLTVFGLNSVVLGVLLVFGISDIPAFWFSDFWGIWVVGVFVVLGVFGFYPFLGFAVFGLYNIELLCICGFRILLDFGFVVSCDLRISEFGVSWVLDFRCFWYSD